MTDTNATPLLEVLPQELLADDHGHALLAITAQQAVMPREIDEGVFAILNADGGVEIIETPGYKKQREHDWHRAHTADTPEFLHRQVTVLDVDSLVDYLAHNTGIDPSKVEDDNAHGSGELEMWADIDRRTIKAILDGGTGLRKHTATLQLKTSREWDEWAQVDGKLFKQAEFAQFLENHISTIAEPDGGTLLDVAQTLQATTSTVFKQQAILANGQRQFRWEETVDARAGQSGDLKIPSELTLVLRPFQGSEPIALLARFRFQIREGVLSLGIKLAEPENAIEEAFGVLVNQLQTQVPVRINHGVG
ncbi:DUF2303 family protein [Tessaracoccus palaemonis]|uniref:YfdQ family protein n=1 Tax=Tessaracoccus palaemonis TaxID=2829499 RepID=A0ABX8SJ99_9ACTN|nr:DUF2303 family protein [Tessaracoccus palaemonis]QXT62740.1 YfdQ family protein [Tessaracoccus palaemonis]